MLQHWALTILLIAGLQTSASSDLSSQPAPASFDFLPAANPAQQEVKNLLKANNFKAALMAWGSAFSNTGFANSDTGSSVLAYLLYKNEMPYLGLKTLLKETQPQHVHPHMLRMWNAEIVKSPFIQKGWITGTGRWKTALNNEPQIVNIKKKKDISDAFVRASGISKESPNARARVLWQIVTMAPTFNDLKSALRALSLIKSTPQNVIGADQIASAEARILYQKGDLDGALKAYNQIPKSSSLWIESVEERAWIHLRQNDFDKALGESITLLSPALAPLVGPESYYLANFLSLKACDYPRIFKNSETFKARHSSRLKDIEDLATKGSNKSLNGILESFEKKGVSLESAGANVSAIPRSAFRDQKFLAAMQSRYQILAEMNKANELAQTQTALGEIRALTKFQGEGRVEADRNRQIAVQRLRALAKAELQEYRQILNKLHVVEAEAIQRLHVDDSLKGERSKLAKNEDDGEVLVFPYTTEEVWFDELDNYKARVKDCPTLKGASL